MNKSVPLALPAGGVVLIGGIIAAIAGLPVTLLRGFRVNAIWGEHPIAVARFSDDDRAMKRNPAGHMRGTQCH